MYTVIVKKALLVSIILMMSGCGGSKVVGKLALVKSDRASFSFDVSSDSYPSRGISFEPIANGKSIIPAYDEPIYSSRIRVTIKNMGDEPFTLVYLGENQIVRSGETLNLAELDFKDFGIRIVPKEGKNASIYLEVKFDKKYNSDSWKLVASWSDGP